jgi:hypothetical protein
MGASHSRKEKQEAAKGRDVNVGESTGFKDEEQFVGA